MDFSAPSRSRLSSLQGTCGHVGCCDDSPNRRATKHVHVTKHPVIEGYDPPEGWGWCYVDQIMFDLIAAKDPAQRADPAKSISQKDRKFYAKAYAQPGHMKAGFEIFRAFEKDADDFAGFAKIKLPMLVLSGEKAGGGFLIEQGKLGWQPMSKASSSRARAIGRWRKRPAR